MRKKKVYLAVTEDISPDGFQPVRAWVEQVGDLWVAYHRPIMLSASKRWIASDPTTGYAYFTYTHPTRESCRDLIIDNYDMYINITQTEWAITARERLQNWRRNR